MAKNKPRNKQVNKQAKQAPTTAQKQAPKKSKPNYTLLILLAVVGITFIAYTSAIYNEMTNWDDNRYVYDNTLVKSLSFSNIAYLFNFHTYVGGNYHPLAILSLAIDYNLYGLTPTSLPGSFEGTGYHVTSILIHLCSVIALYFFCLRLTKEVWVAAITALLFGIHPMHVESVAWISERKDQLYVLFYFVALYFYVRYQQNQKDEKPVLLPIIIISLLLPFLIVISYIKLINYFYSISFIVFAISLALIITLPSNRKALVNYMLVILFFILSLLSKGQGVTLPVVLLLIDYFMNRQWKWNMFIEKIPFFILSIFFGIVAVLAQKTSHSIQDIKIYPYMDRVKFACYALLQYLNKMVAPVSLSAFYEYPEKTGGSYPLIITISPYIVLALFAIALWFMRKSSLVVFGVLFFMANIILLLQLLPVGSAIMSDRYTYLAYTGLFFIIAVLANNIIKRNTSMAKSLRPLLYIGLVIYFSFLAFTTYARNQVWHNSETLWTDVIKENPRTWLAYNQVGSVHQKQGKLDIAFMDFKNAIGLNPDYPEAYVNRSDIYRVRGKLDSAIRDCDSALKYKPNYPEAYINRGIARANIGLTKGDMGEIDSAMGDFKRAVHLDNNLPNVYANMGNIYDMKGKTDSAIFCYTKAIKLDPTQVGPYENRGRSYREKGFLDSAINDLNNSIQMYQAINQNAVESYYERSLAYTAKGNKAQALHDAQMARSLGKKIDEAYINSLK